MTAVKTDTSHDVRDLRLADEGKRRTEWAERFMPVLRQIRERLAPKAKTAFEVVETPVGHQAQFDWASYVLQGGIAIELWGCTLSWSRGYWAWH